MKTRFIFQWVLVLVLGLSSSLMNAKDVYLSATGASDLNDGLSAEKPVATLSKAISIAIETGDIIHVSGFIDMTKEPTDAGNPSTNGGSSIIKNIVENSEEYPVTYNTWNISVASGTRGVKLLDKGVTFLGDDKETCGFDAKGEGTALRMDGLGSLAVLKNLTIKNGNGNKSADSGAGAYIRQAKVRFENCLFKDNFIDAADNRNGGALSFSSEGYLTARELTLVDCEFTGNKAREGSVIYATSGAINISGCSFTGNGFENNAISGWNNSKGGALYFNNTTATGLTVEVNNSTFTGNIAQQFGGVGHFVNTENSTGSTLNVTFNGCTFSGNKCGYEGGEGSGGVFSARIQRTIGKINLAVNNSSCTGNTAKNGGVALLERASDDGENTQLNVTFNGGSITGNQTTESGGVFFIRGARLYPTSAINLLIDGVNISNNTASQNGGVFEIPNGLTPVTVSVRNSTISSNTSVAADDNKKGGGVYRISGNGSGSEVTMNFTNTTLSNNTAGLGGVAFSEDNNGATVTSSFTDCVLSGNSATKAGGTGPGGGVFRLRNQTSGTTINFTALRSTFSGNTSVTNGGVGVITTQSGTIVTNTDVKFTDCSFTENKATSDGGVFYVSHERVDAVLNLSVINSTAYNNQSSGQGGFIAVNNASAATTFNLINSTVTGNISNASGAVRFFNTSKLATRNIYNSIIEGNRNATNGISSDLAVQDPAADHEGRIRIANSFIGNFDAKEESYTLIGDNNKGYYTNVNQAASSVLVDAADYFARFNAIPIKPAALAIGYGDAQYLTAFGITTDQLGAPRPATGGINAGAIETLPATVWNGATDADWETQSNWSYGSPLALVDAVIKANEAGIYPAVPAATTIKNLSLEAGAELAAQNNLTFTKASVEYDVPENRWNMIAVPLAATSGNFYFNDAPKSFIRTFTVSDNNKAGWLPVTDLEHTFAIGDGFVFRLKDTPKKFTLEGAVLAGAQVIESLTFGNGGEGFDSNFAIAGNPFLTTIDFTKLVEANTNVINSSYLIWTGEGFTGYSTLGRWGVLVPDALDKYIAPLQSFIVEKGSAGTNLVFDLATVSADATGQGKLKVDSPVLNKLEIIATNDAASVLTFIANRAEGQDSRKLLSCPNELPDIYTLKEETALGAHIIQSNDVLIPLGLSTTYSGEMKLTLKGMDSYDAFITLIDRVAKKELPLTGLPSFDYPFTYTPVIVSEETLASEDRFFIQISSTPTGVNSVASPSTVAYAKDHAIVVASGEVIRQVEVYNAQGALVYAHPQVNARSYVIPGNRTIPEICIVKVITGSEVKTIKILIK